MRGFVLAGLVLASQFAVGAEAPAAREGDFVIHKFKLSSGETLPEVRIHYHAFGEPKRDSHGVVRNAVLIVHGTGGTGGSLIRPEFSGELFGHGQLLDATRYFIVLPDALGHGKSSKPSDGLHARFPRYGYNDMVETEYRLLTDGLGVKHARLIMGTSMGCMHTWLWGEQHAEFMDALMPLACLPTQVSGRNRVWRRLVSDAIRNDPAWKAGEYTTQPPALRTALEMTWLVGSNPALRQKEAPTLAEADRAIDDYVAKNAPLDDVNDILYQVESSYDYDPGPGLEKIRAPLYAVNSADDLVNPPELGILERQIHRVPHGKAVVIPFSDQTRGHGSHTIAVLWKQYLQELLQTSDRGN
ncbi:MAG: homoserine O-acetyltransferase/O-succinyltransferase [Gammaproteobacteria bacterium]|jgi:homoserine O-acetyltransferase|nr:homoserine O-acetyltransferase/O-succinyltransferase [Gammaproteobacteria bacterium]